MLNGVLLLDKPQGFTSHDGVAKLRGILRQKKIGHAGTLDPMATGLLVVLLGNATRASDHAGGQDKEYLARLRLGQTTDTQDITGQTLEIRPAASRGELEAILPRFTGRQLQLPPMYSAVQVAGKRLYDLARQGKEIERQPRPVMIRALELLPSGAGAGPADYDLRVVCSKGTYVRTLAHDIGQALGCGGCLAALRRTASGRFSLEESLTFDQITGLQAENALSGRLFPTDWVYADLSAVILNLAGAVRAGHGAFLTAEHLASGQIPPEGSLCRVYDAQGRFCQIGRSGLLERGGQAIFCKTNFLS